MKFSTNRKRLVERVVNVFAAGNSNGNYSAIAIFSDGLHNIRQITDGRSAKLRSRSMASKSFENIICAEQFLQKVV